MAQETRDLFFSVACDSIGIRQNMKGEQQQKAIQGNKKGKGDTRLQFCTAFGNKDAWAVSRNYGVAAEGEQRLHPTKGVHMYVHLLKGRRGALSLSSLSQRKRSQNKREVVQMPCR